MKPIEMEVDDVIQAAKSGKDKSILKGTATIEGVEVQFSLSVICDAMDILEVLGIDERHKTVNLRIENGFQQSL